MPQRTRESIAPTFTHSGKKPTSQCQTSSQYLQSSKQCQHSMNNQSSMPSLDVECPVSAGEDTAPTFENSGKVSTTLLRRAAGHITKPASQGNPLRQYHQFSQLVQHSMSSMPSLKVECSANVEEPIILPTFPNSGKVWTRPERRSALPYVRRRPIHFDVTDIATHRMPTRPMRLGALVKLAPM